MLFAAPAVVRGRGCAEGPPALRHAENVVGPDSGWVAGVELAIASEPPARRPRIWGVALRASTPVTLSCNPLLNHALPQGERVN
jgi:hypothetical protein